MTHDSNKKHLSHTTRSSDASSFDEVCVHCGATDIAGVGWGKLAELCSNVTLDNVGEWLERLSVRAPTENDELYEVFNAVRGLLTPSPISDLINGGWLFAGLDDLVRTCPECSSGDINWCNISVRPYCAECKHWGEVNFGTANEAISKWNQAVTVRSNS